MEPLSLTVLLLTVLAFAVVAWLSQRDEGGTAAAMTPPENAIVIDGSNLLYWGKGPSIDVLCRVLRDLEQRGYAPIVFFDANVGYVIDDFYYDEARLAPLIGRPEKHICVVSKGVVADVAILAFATDHGLRVVTNDQYRDWRVQFPIAAKKGQMLRGRWRDGSVVWRGAV